MAVRVNTVSDNHIRPGQKHAFAENHCLIGLAVALRRLEWRNMYEAGLTRAVTVHTLVEREIEQHVANIASRIE